MTSMFAQNTLDENKWKHEITSLIEKYTQSRETPDTILLKSILTSDVDQLVSSGEWRNGIGEAVDGMVRSSNANPGTRTLEVEKIRFINDEIALVDCRYNIKNQDGTERNMWSSFVVIFHKKEWKISAIRNMSPTAGN